MGKRVAKRSYVPKYFVYANANNANNNTFIMVSDNIYRNRLTTSIYA